ncbi:hypothetical protein RRG08_065655 [Elysia crispata]|uniref:Uncharacterized protein n=1 Tax=Elysia crispata TaxID=231223 RepID=A0AAE0YMW7_9GAST|nr:hypothetical protein RRG08_065655 [Elysia crispata]
MTRREVTSKAGIKERASMTTETALAMKETVGLTWKKRTAGIRQEDRKMKTIMECHLLQVAPFLHSYIPPTKRRKTSQK